MPSWRGVQSKHSDYYKEISSVLGTEFVAAFTYLEDSTKVM